MKRLYSVVFFYLVFFLLPFCIFADDEVALPTVTQEISDIDIIENTESDSVYELPNSDDWDLLKSFLSTMLNAECIIDSTFNKNFKLTEGEISMIKKGDDTYYYCKNVTLISSFDDTVLVKNLTGSFSFNPRSNIVKAKFVAVFPLLDSNVHNIKIHPVLKNGKLDYFVVNLDNKVLKIDQSSFYMMMLSGFEFALEHIFR